ncbi:hypothetical protein ACFYQ5_34725 [Streptomyces sp. NPDC005794]|uniref:hypothetical protein n=1 Tax=Streptomyces sp. NPDC005794 TaxID=3364733 RepID=UPI0036D04D78
MPDINVEAEDLAARYVARVEEDLARNTEEQERIDQEIESLRQRQEALQRNRVVLLGVQTALRGQIDGNVPAPHGSTAGSEGSTVPQRPDQSGTPRMSEPGRALKPTLVDLVCSHLSGQPEPRSAGEVSTDIAESHPERPVKLTVVRATLEALVAQGRVSRSKQGRSVFYSSTPLGREMSPAS